MTRLALLITLLMMLSVYHYPAFAQEFTGGSDNSPAQGQQNQANTFNTIQTEINSALKSTIQGNFQNASSLAARWLGILATFYLVGTVIRSFLTGTPFLSNIALKMLLFVGLSQFLGWGTFNQYFFKPVESIFINLPTVFFANAGYSGNDGGNSLFTSFFNIAYSLQTQIWESVSGGFSLSKIGELIIGVIATLAIWALCLICFLSILIANIKFYLTLCLSPLWILFLFLNFTRGWAMGAIKVLVGATINMTLLAAFMGMYAGIITKVVADMGKGQVSFEGFLVFTALAMVGIYFMTMIEGVSQEIIGASISGAKEAAKIGRTVASHTKFGNKALTSAKGLLK